MKVQLCGIEGCRLCARNIPGEPPDSGHPAGEESAASLLFGGLVIAAWFALVLWVLPVLAS